MLSPAAQCNAAGVGSALLPDAVLQWQAYRGLAPPLSSAAHLVAGREPISPQVCCMMHGHQLIVSGLLYLVCGTRMLVYRSLRQGVMTEGIHYSPVSLLFGAENPISPCPLNPCVWRTQSTQKKRTRTLLNTKRSQHLRLQSISCVHTHWHK